MVDIVDTIRWDRTRACQLPNSRPTTMTTDEAAKAPLFYHGFTCTVSASHRDFKRSNLISASDRHYLNILILDFSHFLIF